MTPVLELKDAAVRYRGTAADVVEDVSLAVEAGESLALVGESGAVMVPQLGLGGAATRGCWRRAPGQAPRHARRTS